MPTEYLSGTGMPILLAPSAGALSESPRMDEGGRINPLYLALGLLAVVLLYKEVAK